MSSLKILASGTSGPIGGALVPALTAAGHQVTRLVRRPAAAADEIEWDPMGPLHPSSISGYDGIIHLAGETIVSHWDQKKREKIRDSRVTSTRNLVQALLQTRQKPGCSSPHPPSAITAIAARKG